MCIINNKIQNVKSATNPHDASRFPLRKTCSISLSSESTLTVLLAGCPAHMTAAMFSPIELAYGCVTKHSLMGSTIGMFPIKHICHVTGICLDVNL